MVADRLQVIDRASADDVMSLVSDRHDPPLQVGAILLFDVGPPSSGSDDVAGLDPAGLIGVLGERLAAVPRLRQRLVDVPFGCGRPVWVDYPDFDLDQHVDVVHRSGPSTEESVLRYAAVQITTRLSRDRPLWSARLLVGEEGRPVALILVVHHVLADGIAGLAVLGRLVDGGPLDLAPGFPRPAPTVVRLALEAASSRVRSLRRLPGTVRRLASAVVELGPSLRTQAAPCSLLRPTGAHRRLLVVRSDLAPAVQAAHQSGGTVNDVILTAITGALRVVLLGRGEDLPAFVVSIPMSSRPQLIHGELGNHSGVVPVLLPATGPFPARLAAIANVTRAAKRHQRGASTSLLGPVFRLLAALGVYQHFIDHQRSIHTFVSNLRGPDIPVTLCGHPVGSIVPIAVASGNVTVSFTALSYAGRLVITIGADPDTCPDLSRLRREVERQLPGN
jgi:diacylglycerol O-acyltransferase